MKPSIHEQILRAALGDGNTMSAEALGWVIAANKMSDLNQFGSSWHFDSARNRQEICERWEKGLNSFMNRAVELSEPMGAAKTTLRLRKGALEAFGRATHALQDFYSHSNWVELMVAQGKRQALAPLLGEICKVKSLPSELQSGYFSLRYGKDGCPEKNGKLSPPKGFRYCHEQIAKDYPNKGHGADKVSRGGPKYHELAVQMAIKATRQLWETLHDRIVSKYGSDESTDAEAVFTKLAWGGNRTCHTLWVVKGDITGTHIFVIPQTPRLSVDHRYKGYTLHLTWKPIRYPGPRAAAVFAPVEGKFEQRGSHTHKNEAGTFNLGKANFEGSLTGKLKVTPDPQPLEFTGILVKDVAKFAISLDLKIARQRLGPYTKPGKWGPAPLEFTLILDASVELDE